MSIKRTFFKRSPINLAKVLALGVALTCASEDIRSQDQSAISLEVPSGDLLKAAPEFAKWTVTFNHPNQQTPEAPRLTGDETREVITTKTGNVISETLVDGRGCRTETWYVGPLQYRKPHGKPTWFESSPSIGLNAVNTDYVPLPPNGFRGWEWVGRDTFVGRTGLEGGELFVFVPGGSRQLILSANPSQAKEQLAAQPMVAMVNPETRLPVSLRTGGVTQRFVFAPAPTTIQSLPVELLEQIQKGEEARRRLYQQAPRPY